MTRPHIDTKFSGSIPQIYETHLVPLIFEPYAADLVKRLSGRTLAQVLEIAAGTGVVTRAMAAGLPASVSIMATDLNQAMLDRAGAVGTQRPVMWRHADALQLPFGDGTFDAVVCQFGAMFFPDKARGFAEARRVLRPGGVFIFNVWDRLADNEFPDTINAALGDLFPDDPPRFLGTPYGYFDGPTIEGDLASGGFTTRPQLEIVTARSRAGSPRIPALAFCEGTPLRNELEARGDGRLAEATDAAAQAIARKFGDAAVDAKIQAVVVTIER